MDEKLVPTIPKDALTALVRRLEAATSRLEDMASAAVDTPKTNGTVAPSTAAASVAPAAAPTPPAPAKPIPEPVPESVEEFDAFLGGTLKKFVNLSDELGGPVSEQVRNSVRLYIAGLT